MFALSRRSAVYLKPQRHIAAKLPSQQLHILSKASVSALAGTSVYHTPSRFSNSLATHVAESFLAGNNSHYIDEMYRQWQHDPNSVHKSWDVFFRQGTYTPPPQLVADYTGSSSRSTAAPVPAAAASSVQTTAIDSRSLTDMTKVIQMVRAFQVRGHYMANLDPLGITSARRITVNPQELQLSHYGFSEADLNREVQLHFSNTKGFLSGRDKMTLGEIYTRLCEAYSGTVGVEYMHIPDVEQCNWIRERFETTHKPELSKEQKLKLLERLTWADHFELFLARKFATSKRFGLEGVESMIPGLKTIIDKSSELGVESVVMGMPHRGRLNVLSTVVRKPMEQIFHEFQGTLLAEAEGSGDVKYHLGMSHTRPTHAGKVVRLSLVANPSHLEAVNPVVAGKVRAKQFYKNDAKREKALGLLIHGDAAFAGQGVVYETFGMQDLPDYTTGGTIHIICNNQIGFTTDPSFSRSAPYCTDIARAFNAPIFHVNADDPEAIIRVCEIAAEWRQRFKKDVVVDMVGYRRHGHNEIDEPSFTQPKMYSHISSHPSVLKLYTQKLISQGDITAEEAHKISQKVNSVIDQKFEASKTYTPTPSEWLSTQWTEMKPMHIVSAPRPTGISQETFKHIGDKVSGLPDGFAVHPRLQSMMKQRQDIAKTGKGIDWATAEALAFGSLLMEGTHVRLSGQDVERGTFSHRHSVLHDQKTFNTYTALNNLSPNQAAFSVSNSHLSEFGVLGFELGYSLENPRSLVLWEAQFGDFTNGAQVILDQFIASGESKWRRQSGIVLLLPHGYEGAGPEHSSARLERFLQCCSDHPDVIPDSDPKTSRAVQALNWQVLNMTSPANYFHALRRQIHRDFRKPLVIMSPKSLLRHRLAKSNYEEIMDGTMFVPLIPDRTPTLAAANKVRRVLFCSGKVYFDLLQYREENKANDVAIVRVEQLAPFPFHAVAEEMSRFSKAEAVWVQEEPMNMGAWAYAAPRIETALQYKQRPRYVGRLPSASPAAGTHNNHEQELHKFLTEAFKK